MVPMVKWTSAYVVLNMIDDPAMLAFAFR